MINLSFEHSGKGLQVLCLGAHCDDIEIGCGGTLLKLLTQYPIAKVCWVVFASNEQRALEARNSAEMFLETVVNKEIEIHSYRDAFLNFSAMQIKEDFEDLKSKINPDIIFTHYRQDRHQDHKLLADLTWNTFRNHLICEYEIPKYEGDLNQPNMFVKLSEELVDRKIEILMKAFPSQVQKHWYDKETFKALMRIRGIESASASRYAEAFHLSKMSF